MPFVQAKLSVNLDQGKKEVLQKKLTEAVIDILGKPKEFVMIGIEELCPLWMAGEKMVKGAYISVSLVGTPSREACEKLTEKICGILAQDFGIDGKKVYVTYHPVDTWGWDSHLF